MNQVIRDVAPLSDEDQKLVDEYVRLGRPVDQLPYTPEFERLVQTLRTTGDTRSDREILGRLLRLRKAARLPRMGPSQLPPLPLPPADVELLETLIRVELPSPGARDSLLYTPDFDSLLERYNSEAVLKLNRHEFWRMIARISK